MASNASTRRGLLAKLAVGGLAAGASVGFLGRPQERPDGVADQYVDADELALGDRILDADGELAASAPVPRWQRKRTSDGYEPTSPINVAVLLGDDRRFEDVLAVFERYRWRRDPEEYVRYARAPDGSFALADASAAETLFGTASRDHVRCWAFEDVVSIQTHRDSAPTPEHGIDTYRGAREALERLFAAEGWTVASAAVAADNATAPDHDGRLTVIEP